MSDRYGIEDGLRAATKTYFATARRTGRTETMLQSLKGGETVVFATMKEAVRVAQMADARGTPIRPVTIPMNRLDELNARVGAGDRVLLDHNWIETYFTTQIEIAAWRVSTFERSDDVAPTLPPAIEELLYHHPE